MFRVRWVCVCMDTIVLRNSVFRVHSILPSQSKWKNSGHSERGKDRQGQRKHACCCLSTGVCGYQNPINAHGVAVQMAEGILGNVPSGATPALIGAASTAILPSTNALCTGVSKGPVAALRGDVPLRTGPLDERLWTASRHKVAGVDAWQHLAVRSRVEPVLAVNVRLPAVILPIENVGQSCLIDASG